MGGDQATSGGVHTPQHAMTSVARNRSRGHHPPAPSLTTSGRLTSRTSSSSGKKDEKTSKVFRGGAGAGGGGEKSLTAPPTSSGRMGHAHVENMSTCCDSTSERDRGQRERDQTLTQQWQEGGGARGGRTRSLSSFSTFSCSEATPKPPPGKEDVEHTEAKRLGKARREENEEDEEEEQQARKRRGDGKREKKSASREGYVEGVSSGDTPSSVGALTSCGTTNASSSFSECLREIARVSSGDAYYEEESEEDGLAGDLFEADESTCDERLEEAADAESEELNHPGEGKGRRGRRVDISSSVSSKRRSASAGRGGGKQRAKEEEEDERNVVIAEDGKDQRDEEGGGEGEVREQWTSREASSSSFRHCRLPTNWIDFLKAMVDEATALFRQEVQDKTLQVKKFPSRD